MAYTPRTVRRIGRRGCRRAGGRNTLRVDGRGRLPASGKHRHGLHPHGQRQQGGRSRRPFDARRIRIDALHPRRQERIALTLRRSAADRINAAPASRKAFENCYLYTQTKTFDPRFRDRARARLDTQIRRAGAGDRRAERFQLRRTRDRRLRHLLAAGQAARVQHRRRS